MPICGDDSSSIIPCLNVLFESGVLKRVHVPILAPFVIMPEYAYFDARGPLDPDILRRDLALGDLRKLIVELCCAALIDRGLLMACQAFRARLTVRIEGGGAAATSGGPKDQPRALNDNDGHLG